MYLVCSYHLITNHHLPGINRIYKVAMVSPLPIWIVALLTNHAILAKEIVTMIVTADGAYCAEVTTALETFQCSMDSIGRSWQIVVMVIGETSLAFKYDRIRNKIGYISL